MRLAIAAERPSLAIVHVCFCLRILVAFFFFLLAHTRVFVLVYVASFLRSFLYLFTKNSFLVLRIFMNKNRLLVESNTINCYLRTYTVYQLTVADTVAMYSSIIELD